MIERLLALGWMKMKPHIQACLWAGRLPAGRSNRKHPWERPPLHRTIEETERGCELSGYHIWWRMTMRWWIETKSIRACCKIKEVIYGKTWQRSHKKIKNSLFFCSWVDSEFWKERKSRWQRSAGSSSPSKYVFRNSRKPSSLMHCGK